VSKPEPPPDFREDVSHRFALPQLIEHEDLVVSELIPIVVVCHNVSPFIVVALRVSPETKKGRPAKMTDRPTVKVCGGNLTACLFLI